MSEVTFTESYAAIKRCLERDFFELSRKYQPMAEIKWRNREPREDFEALTVSWGYFRLMSWNQDEECWRDCFDHNYSPRHSKNVQWVPLDELRPKGR